MTTKIIQLSDHSNHLQGGLCSVNANVCIPSHDVTENYVIDGGCGDWLMTVDVRGSSNMNSWNNSYVYISS